MTLKEYEDFTNSEEYFENNEEEYEFYKTNDYMIMLKTMMI